MRFFDTHTHVNFNAFRNDWQETIERALKDNIWLVNVGSQSTTSKRAVEIAENYEKGVYAAIGLHPSHSEEQEFNEDYYLELAKNEKVVAIGECGLDYYIENSKFKNQNEKFQFKIQNYENFKELQQEVFLKHIKLADKIKKPLIIHCRDAHNDLINILTINRELLIDNRAGIMHFFTGTLEQAQRYIDLGFYISFSGVITFTDAYDDIVKNLPLDRILIETDAPYVTPTSYRGKRNESSYVIEVAKKIAEIKEISLEEVAEKTAQNARIVFNIKE